MRASEHSHIKLGWPPPAPHIKLPTLLLLQAVALQAAVARAEAAEREACAAIAQATAAQTQQLEVKRLTDENAALTGRLSAMQADQRWAHLRFCFTEGNGPNQVQTGMPMPTTKTAYKI